MIKICIFREETVFMLKHYYFKETSGDIGLTRTAQKVLQSGFLAIHLQIYI